MKTDGSVDPPVEAWYMRGCSVTGLVNPEVGFDEVES